VDGARSEAEAQRLAMTGPTSPRVKTLAYGEDSTGGVLGRPAVPGWRSIQQWSDIYFGRLCMYRREPHCDLPEKAGPLKLRKCQITYFACIRGKPGSVLDCIYRTVCRHQRALPDVNTLTPSLSLRRESLRRRLAVRGGQRLCEGSRGAALRPPDLSPSRRCVAS